MTFKRTLLLLAICTCFVANAVAQKYNYTYTVHSIVMDGDTLNLSKDVVKTGVVKKSTKRLPIASLNDGGSLHVELVITTEGVMMDKYTVIQMKYYTKKDDQWTLYCVTRKLKFKGSHFDKGTFEYNDPQSTESLAVNYTLIMES